MSLSDLKPQDMIRQEALTLAGLLKFACYRVLDPEIGEYGPRQFHMTYNNTVLAVMGEEAAKSFVAFVTRCLQKDVQAATTQESDT